jgi:hypothetical protein
LYPFCYMVIFLLCYVFFTYCCWCFFLFHIGFYVLAFLSHVFNLMIIFCLAKSTFFLWDLHNFY